MTKFRPDFARFRPPSGMTLLILLALGAGWRGHEQAVPPRESARDEAHVPRTLILDRKGEAYGPSRPARDGYWLIEAPHRRTKPLAREGLSR